MEGRFLSLVPSSGAASARSSLDSAAWRDPDGDEDALSDAGGGGAGVAAGGERAGRPSTAKRQLEQILRSKLDVRNIHISGEAAEAGWGGPGATASAAKSRLQSLLDGGGADNAEVCGG